MIKAGSWVLIERVVLTPEERPSHLPPETKKVPLMMWMKGTLECDAMLGDWVTITTQTKRHESGVLKEVNPTYHHNYGNFVPEIHEIAKIVRRGL
jgi:hypothetical protein